MLSALSFHQNLLFRWQMTEVTSPTMMTTMTLRAHPNTRAIVDPPESTSSHRATNPGSNARHQPIDAIYGSKTLIKKEKE
jgi:hypothetical protein